MSDSTPELPAKDEGEENPNDVVGEEVPPDYDDEDDV